MRKELGPARITVIVDGSDRVGRDVVGERVARVVGGLQQQHREALKVIVGSSRTETETETAGETPPGSALAPPLSPSPSPSPSSPAQLTAARTASGKLQNRVDESRSRLACYGFHKQWWQRWPADTLGPHWVYRRRRQLLKKKLWCWTPGEHMVMGLAKRLQRIEQQIRDITRKHEILRYERVAEKYMQWQNHLREQMMIRRWGTRKNAELDREKRRDSVRLACLRRRRDDLARLVG